MRQTFCLFKSNYGQPDVGSQAPTRKTLSQLSQCQSVRQSDGPKDCRPVSSLANSLKQNAANHAPNFGYNTERSIRVGVGWRGVHVRVEVYVVYIFHINVYKLCVFIRKIQ